MPRLLGRLQGRMERIDFVFRIFDGNMHQYAPLCPGAERFVDESTCYESIIRFRFFVCLGWYLGSKLIYDPLYDFLR